MKRIIFLVLILAMPRTGIAQLSSYSLDGSKTMRLSLFQGKLTNEWTMKIENESHSAFVIDVSNSRTTIGAFKYQASHRYKFLGDIISVLYTPPGLAEKPNPGTPSLTSVFGWHNWGMSFISTKYIQVSAGVHLGDYFYGVEGLHPSDRKAIENTSGTINYYGGAGPALIVDVALFDSGVFFHYEGSYAFTFGETPVFPDQKPEMLNQIFELRYNRAFLNFELVNGLNNTGNRIVRRQIGLGLSINMGKK